VFLERGRLAVVATFWDVDGNVYVDYLLGLGVDHSRIRLSHRYREAVSRQMASVGSASTRCRIRLEV
jgi:glutamate-1-semialdehyde aminotransferase